MSTMFHARLVDGTGRIVAEGDMESTRVLPRDDDVRRFYLGNIVNYAYNQPGPASGQAFSLVLSLRSDAP